MVIQISVKKVSGMLGCWDGSGKYECINKAGNVSDLVGQDRISLKEQS